jgi:hypothetical protein
LKTYPLLVAVILLPPFPAFAQKPASSIAGAWEGQSICTVRDSPCHDEHIIYEISRDTPSQNNPDRLGPALQWKIDAYKIVNGKKDFMGTLPCSFDEKKQTLSCVTKTSMEGHWEYVFDGDTIRGTLHVGPEKTLYRNVSAKRVPKTQ